MNTGKRVSTHYGALDAFFPAVLALSGDTDRAARLQQSSNKMWNLVGIEPEELDYVTMKITEPGYPLRPEIIESAYYLHYFTSDPKYLDMGETYFDALEKYCRTDAGYAALKNVETKEKADRMESFFLAETLKYLYLLYAPRTTIDLNKSSLQYRSASAKENLVILCELRSLADSARNYFNPTINTPNAGIVTLPNPTDGITTFGAASNTSPVLCSSL